MQEDKQRMSSRRTSRIRKTSLHWLLLYKTCPFEKIPCVLRSNLEGTFIYGGMVEFSGLYRLDPNAVVLVKRKFAISFGLMHNGVIQDVLLLHC